MCGLYFRFIAFIRVSISGSAIFASHSVMAQNSLGPSSAPRSANTQVLNPVEVTGVKKSAVFGSLEKLSTGGELLAKTKYRMPTVSKFLGGAASVFSMNESYHEGLEHGQEKYQAAGRGFATWGVSTYAGVAAVGVVCGTTAGLGCLLLGAGVAYTTDKLSGKAYDYGLNWYDQKLDALVGKNRLDNADSSMPGEECIQWNEPGRPECGDGTHTRTQSGTPFIMPPMGGRAPDWIGIGR